MLSSNIHLAHSQLCIETTCNMYHPVLGEPNVCMVIRSNLESLPVETILQRLQMWLEKKWTGELRVQILLYANPTLAGLTPIHFLPIV